MIIMLELTTDPLYNFGEQGISHAWGYTRWIITAQGKTYSGIEGSSFFDGYRKLSDAPPNSQFGRHYHDWEFFCRCTKCGEETEYECEE